MACFCRLLIFLMICSVDTSPGYISVIMVKKNKKFLVILFSLYLMCSFLLKHSFNKSTKNVIDSVYSISWLFIISFGKRSGMFSFWMGLWKNEYLGFLMFSESLFETNHWLMFSNSWFTIWNKYLISLCVKNKLVSSANIIGSNMFEAFFSRSHIKEIGVVLKLSLVEHYNWSSLSLLWKNCLLFER